jgi:hypothetical protein
VPERSVSSGPVPGGVDELGPQLARMLALAEDSYWLRAVMVAEEVGYETAVAGLIGALLAALKTIARASGQTLDEVLMSVMALPGPTTSGSDHGG